MKLVRYGPAGRERPGLIDPTGQLRDLGDVVDDLGPDQLSPRVIARLARLDPMQLPAVSGRRRMGCPVTGVGKFVAIGLNYADHAAEAAMPIPSEPIVFLKATTCIQGPNDNVVLPPGSRKTDWEVELGVVIGMRARHVTQEHAMAHVAGYCLVNDISERAYQLERGGTWDKGKGCDTFGPVGPWLLTRDEVADPQNLDLWLDLNGQRMQTGNTRTMIFSVAELISYVSRFMTLEPGDIVTTGTPPGVGMGRKTADGRPAPQFLQPGDVLQLGGTGLGSQRQRVRAFSA